MRRGCHRCGCWCGVAICIGAGILLMMCCPLRLLLMVAAIILVVLGLLMLKC